MADRVKTTPARRTAARGAVKADAPAAGAPKRTRKAPEETSVAETEGAKSGSGPAKSRSKASGRKGEASGGKTTAPVGKAKTRKPAAPTPFDMEAEELPDWIEERALASGNHPYPKRLKRKKYEKRLLPLQIELLKLQAWAHETGERIVIVFEGRDGAGKGGAISRFTQHLPPRQARVVALSKPSDTEKGQWYFQRYAAHLPTRGEIVFFDRSWYNRAGVERVMGFCTPEETEEFLREAPAFEGMLVRDGVRLFKLFLTIGREMQMKRLHARWHDPLKHWKLSPIDFKAIEKFDDYSAAFETLLARTSTDRAPWTVIRSNDKLRARLEAIRHVLAAVPYKDKDESVVGEVDGKIVLAAADYLDEGGES